MNLIEVNKATGFISEAKKTLDVGFREQLIKDSYLGELTHIDILKKSLELANKGIGILEVENSVQANKLRPIVCDVERALASYLPKPKPKPKVVSKSVSSKIEVVKPSVVKKPRVSKKRGGK